MRPGERRYGSVELHVEVLHLYKNEKVGAHAVCVSNTRDETCLLGIFTVLPVYMFVDLETFLCINIQFIYIFYNVWLKMDSRKTSSFPSDCDKR